MATYGGRLMANILVACETSGRVREAFRKLGHNAWSCDVLPADGCSNHHFQCDVMDLIPPRWRGVEWDLMVAHPPCTYICNSGVSWLHREEGRWDKLDDGAKFFKELLDAPIPRIAIENPIPHKYGVERIGRKYDQIIQPWQYGHGETKATCLWLKNLPKLVPTDIVEGRFGYSHSLPPSEERWKLRSITYQGIADAIADQWSEALNKGGNE